MLFLHAQKGFEAQANILNIIFLVQRRLRIDAEAERFICD